MARATKEESLKTRQRIIDTAIDLFYQNGVSVITLEKIAESANLTRGAIYWHFKNKKDVICAIHEQFHISILETMNKELEDTSRKPLERIKTATLSFLHDLEHDTLSHRVMSIFNTKIDYSGDLADLLAEQEECKREGRDLIAKCFAEAVTSSEINTPYSAEWLTNSYMIFITGLITEYLSNKKPYDLGKEAPLLLEFFFSKLK